MIWSLRYVALLGTFLIHLTSGYQFVRFESMPTDLQEYWNTKVLFCGSRQDVHLKLTCDMYYSGEKSPFRAMNLTNTIKMKRRKRRHVTTITSECCESECTRWTFKDYCWSDDPEVYRPSPKESTTTAAPPKTTMRTTTRMTTSSMPTTSSTSTTTTTTTTTTEKPRKKLYYSEERIKEVNLRLKVMFEGPDGKFMPCKFNWDCLKDAFAEGFNRIFG